MAFRPRVRGLLRLLRHAPDRLAHGIRRERALKQLAALAEVRGVLVVCHGNVCRSPYAALALRRRLEANGDVIQVASAGFVGPNRAPPTDAVAVAGARGTDLTAHRSQLLSRSLLDAATVVLVMNTRQRATISARRPELTGRIIVLGDLDPQPISTREIVDPWGRSRETFEDSYNRIDRCMAQFLRALRLSPDVSR
jgi:protein-tyrosine phosphatase